MATAGNLSDTINRFGLSQIYSSPGEGLVDIVFIHGLNGHPYDTWTSEKSKIFWPGQLLPIAINKEKARKLVYGYNADVVPFVGKVSKDNIHNHAEQLVAELCANRRRQKATERPLIFVAHSLGGLVVKRALIYSSEIRSNKTEHLRSIYISTYGILFLGTPHGGSDVAEWGSQIERICGALLPTRSIGSQPQLVNASYTNSETVQNIDRSFIQLASQFHIYFFHEGKPTNLNGTLRYIVNEESASPNIQDVERACIQQDHSHMCKFETDSAPGFHIVTEAISRYSSQALDTIILRWNIDKAAQLKRTEAQVEELLPIRHIENNPPGNTNMLTPDSSKVFRPLFLVPFSRNATFINRIEIFTDIDTYMKQHRRVALSGIGENRKLQSNSVIDSAMTILMHKFFGSTPVQSNDLTKHTEIARRVELPGRNDPSIDTLRLVLNWFNGADDKSWLMILDNADDLKLFFARSTSTATDSESTLPLIDYLPQSSRGSMLITTRDERLAKRVAGTHASIVVNPMSLSEAQELLESRRKKPLGSSDRDHSSSLFEALGYIPLAIAQAAAFIDENYMTLSQYLAMFFSSNSELQDLLSEDLEDPRRDSQSLNSIVKTWKISFQYGDMGEICPYEYSELLYNVARLDLEQGRFEKACAKYLATIEVQKKSFGLDHHSTLLSMASLGRTYARLGRLKEAEKLQVQAAKDMKRVLGLEHVSTFDCLNDLTMTYIDQSRWEEAEKLQVRVVGDMKRVLGAEDRRTLPSVDNLAYIYGHQGRLKEAKKLHVQVIDARKRMLGVEHPHTLQSMNNLAVTYRRRCEWEEAEALLVQVVEMSKRLQGAEHSGTLISMGNLANTYRSQGRWKEAETLSIQVLETQEEVLSSEHPDTLTTKANLAITWSEQDRRSEAVAMMESVLESRRKILGANHEGTIRAASWLERWLDTYGTV